ncbi:MAG: BadF/BadG/BcrA/BcrD ATPase family protein [Acidobacteriota bacterium]
MSFFLGVDGGQTAIKAILGDESGRVLGMGRGGPAIHVSDDRSRQEVRDSMHEALRALAATAGVSLPLRVRSACLGFSGVTGPEAPAARLYGELASEIIQTEVIEISHDAGIALAGAIPDRVGVIAIAGTGSIAFGRNAKGKTARAGGWGYLIGDPGSAYEIGRSGLMAVAQAHDGTGPPTGLSPLLMEELDVSDPGLIPQVVYRDPTPKLRIAQLCGAVARAAQAGDKTAVGLFTEAGQGLAAMVAAVVRRLAFRVEELIVSGVGGVFRTGELIWESYRSSLLSEFPGARVEAPRFTALIGALLVAYELGGLTVSEAMLRTIENSNQSGS